MSDACTASSKLVLGWDFGRGAMREVLLVRVGNDDDELLVRASAVLKSQGPENWPRGRPGVWESPPPAKPKSP